jgi:glucuronate isomerase
MNVEKEGFAEYIKVLGEAAGIEIKCINCLKNAMKKRMDFFGEMGCSVTDHGLDYVPFRPATDEEVNAIFQKGMKGEPVTDEEAEAFKTWMMLFLGREYAERGWAMQLHYGAIRNNNTKMYRLKGPDTGFDAISDRLSGTALARLLDALAVEGKLPKTIVYSLNPNDNAMITTVMSCFQVGYGDRNHVQHGSAWWFNDTKPGMEQQITNLANESVLGNFVGMLTDSRSFFSYARHEYFRRVLCNVIGTWVENGEYPDDERALREIVRGICYYNAKEYFGF